MSIDLMPEVLKLLGVEYEEQFKLCHFESKVFQNGLFYFDKMKGLVQVTDGDVIYNVCDKLYDILIGYFEIVKLPWEPKHEEIYYSINIVGCEREPMVIKYVWDDYSVECLKDRALGMIYRTEEDARAHIGEVYEKLTGKKLEE